MATPGRGADSPLERTLFDEPYRFDFFQAVRLLERLSPDRAPVGRDGPPSREVARFGAHASLAFPASAIRALERPENADSPPLMTVAFMGLTGPSGVLPLAYSDLIIERCRAGDRTAAALLDILNHRLVSLFYRAWEKYRPALAQQRGPDDSFSRVLFHLIGLGIEPLANRLDVPDQTLPFHAGAFAQRRRPAVMLEALLRDHFGLPVEVEQFVGQWLTLDERDRSVVGSSGPNNGLGASFVLGARVWDEQGKIRLRIGPLTFEQFRTLLPDGSELRAVSQMARLYVDGELDMDVQLILKASDVPACRLSSSPGEGAQLGRFAWLKSREFARDVGDAIFSVA